MPYLCIDIGGTFIKYALFDRDAQQLDATNKVKTRIRDASNDILTQVVELIHHYTKATILEGIAISSAGVVNSHTGKIEYSGYTIPGYTGTEIQSTIESQFGIKCSVLNDVNAASLGEYWKGVGKDAKPNTMVCLTIGTGVGGAIILDGHLYEGPSFTAGEVGYLPLKHGNFQDIASTTALLSMAEKALGYFVTGEEFFSRLQQDHADYAKSKKVFDDFIDNLATGIVVIQYIMNADLIVLGGGILAQEHLILPAVTAKMRNLLADERFMPDQVCAAKLGNNAGMLGALFHHLHTQHTIK